jgi:hypothetical protein
VLTLQFEDRGLSERRSFPVGPPLSPDVIVGLGLAPIGVAATRATVRRAADPIRRRNRS